MSIGNVFTEPGVYSSFQPTTTAPVLPGGVRIAALVGTGRTTNLVVGEVVTRGSGADDALAHTATVLDGTSIIDQNFATYVAGTDYNASPVSGGIGWLSGATFLTGTNPDAVAEDTTASVFFTVTQVVDATHLVVSSTSGLTGGDTVTQGSLTTTITTVTDATHLVVGSTTGWVATPYSSALVGDTFQLASSGVTEPTYTFAAADFTYYGVDTTASVNFVVTQVVDATHLIVKSTAGLAATNSINQHGIASTTTTITTVTDATHLVVGSTANWVPTVLSAADVVAALSTAFTGDGLTFSVTTTGGNQYVTITTVATSNASLSILNGTANSILGFTSGSLVKTPQRPTTGNTYQVDYEYAKVSADYIPTFFFNMTDVINAYGAVTVDGGNNVLYSLPVAAQLVFQAGASVVCLIQVDPADGATLTQFEKAIDKLQGVSNINIVVPLDPDPNLFAYVKAHVDLMSSTLERKERTAIVGMTGTQSVSTMVGYAQALADKRMVLAAFSSTTQAATMFVGSSLTPSTVDGSYLAAALAGIRTSSQFDVADPLTRKEVVGFLTVPDALLRSQKNLLASSGVCVIEVNSGIPRVMFGTTTNPSTVDTREYSVVEIVDFVAVSMRQLLEAIYIGQKILLDTPSQVRSTVSAVLSDIVSRQIINGFQNIIATVDIGDPTQIDVSFEISAVFPLNYILITFSLTV